MEQVKPGTAVLATLPNPAEGCEAALQFQDWLEVAGSVLADVSEQSGQWRVEVVRTVEETYARWLNATPLERLAIAPTGAEHLTSGRWLRLNARISSMLLTAMNETLRQDMVSQRLTQDAVRMVFRLHTTFQPGGSAERQEVLRRLQAPQDYVTTDTVDEALKAIRNWPRWLARCKTVNMSPPDPSVLARGLMSITTRFIQASPDAAFRTSMLRTTLRLDAQPSLEQVTAYQRHLQAELETMVTAKSSTQVPTAAIRAIDKTQPPDKGGPPKTPDKEKGNDMCRYFMKPTGCKRGSRCNFSHSMQHLDKDTMADPGSVWHVGVNPTVRQRNTRTPGSERGGATTSTAATVASVQEAAPSTGSTVNGVPWTLESLVQIAQQVVQSQDNNTRSGDSSPEKVKPEVKTLVVTDIRVCSVRASTAALLDSGATHCLRTAATESEWEEAEDVVVQLAGNHQLWMKMSNNGSLLMPPRTAAPTQHGVQTIVPLGQLVQTLGYTLLWSPEVCYLEDPQGSRLRLKVQGGCPQLCEVEALSLIARIEDRRREALENATLATADAVDDVTSQLNRTWLDYLKDYVQDDNKAAGLRALRDAPFMDDVPGECLNGLVPQVSRSGAWESMKGVSFLTRHQRRRFLHAKRWVIHLFAGAEGHYEFFKLSQGGTEVLELDLHRCRGQDIMRSEVWEFLLWGARMGKIDAIIGGPPGRTKGMFPPNGESSKDLKPMTLVARMLWLHAVAQVGRQVHGSHMDSSRPVGFLMEHPEMKVKNQQPEEEDYVGCDQVWDLPMWRTYAELNDLQYASFDQGAMGGTIATNLYALLSLDELRQSSMPTTEPQDERKESTWAPGLVRAMVVALTFWDREKVVSPGLRAMTPAQWREHVNSNHEHHRKDCATCVMARGTGRRHQKVRHPDAYVLTTDLSGPLKPGLDPTSKGTMGKGLKYLLVGKYVVPKEFVKGYASKEPPGDHGLCQEELPPNPEAEYKDLFGDIEELARPSDQPPQPQEDGSNGETNQAVEPPDSSENLFGDIEELARPSQPPPQEDGSFIFDGAPAEGSPYILEAPAEGSPQEEERLPDPIEEEEIDYDPSYAGDSEPEEAQPEGPVTGTAAHAVMEAGDCHPPEFTHLVFAVGLPNNLATTVKAAIQDIYLGGHGMPVYRFHGDRGECFNHHFRSWLRDQGIRATWTELVPYYKPQNYLYGYGQWRPKLRQLNNELRRREKSLESKWSKGRYVGLSSLLQRGHVVYLPDDEGDTGEKFLHTFHVRSGLIEPPQPDVELIIDPKPRRKVTIKTSPKDIEMRVLTLSREELAEIATNEADKILADWDWEEARALVVKLAMNQSFKDMKFGVYRLLAKLVVDVEPTATFTSVYEENFGQNFEKETKCKLLYPNVRRYHEVLDWEGNRTMVIAYTPQCLGKLSQGDVTILEEHGFPTPLSQLPEAFGGEPPPGVRTLQTGFDGQEPQGDEFVSEDPTREAPVEDDDVNGWEMFLELEPGRGMVKVASEALGLQQIPERKVMKTEVVYTTDVETIINNLSAPLEVTYTVDPREVLRCLEFWEPAIRKEVAGVEVMELWGLIRALYGLRQSPALWGSFRDEELAQLSIPQGLRLQQGKIVSSWWSVLDSNNEAVGIIIIYVDDFMILGAPSVVEMLTTAIQGLWDTSPLSWLGPSNTVRFLGMELSMNQGMDNLIYVSQAGYIQELLRHHELPAARQDKIPVSKELSSFAVESTDLPPDDYTVHWAQRLTGEILWLSQRSRPDLSYTTSLMSTLCTRAPHRVVEVGLKALSYLKRTSSYQLQVGWEPEGLVMFSDAAYAPQAEKSHSGWLVRYNSMPVLWRSSRQPMTTLSTAESELLAMTEGTIAMKGVECLLSDVKEEVEDREIASDSLAALAISAGSSSWRTRHLRIRSNWMVEQITRGMIKTRHCPGERQLADMLTKPLSSQRLQMLLELWGIKEKKNKNAATTTTVTGAASKAALAIVCCLLMMTVEATPTNHRSGSLELDSNMLNVMMTLLMLLGFLMVYEGLKWLVLETYREWTPGARERKIRRLEKLRDATSRAIQQELQRREPTATSTSSRATEGPSSPLVTTTRAELRTPRTITEPTPQESPGGWSCSTTRVEQDDGADRERICQDVLALMRCEELREGLRLQGISGTGLKADLVNRLAATLVPRPIGFSEEECRKPVSSLVCCDCAFVCIVHITRCIYASDWATKGVLSM
ncbi:unnamed protein product [Symbiodinium microadriaticum]|nr:unnamed protein product [Symbiodinium microadriaticum]